MRLRVIGDDIVTDGLDLVATFCPQLLPTLRDRAEELLLAGADEGDWEQKERLIEQQDRIEELENLVADQRVELEEARRVLG